jgi:hypothetical protein
VPTPKEYLMSENDPLRRQDEPDLKARHGYRNEVNWEGGSGRQPYTNQRGGVPSPGARSGVTQDQFEQAKRKP